ncbi:MAG: pseudouridine synthase [Erysipelotrichaceae bacterium]|nr:pseudouridine synthase [Erysipelotrichaceae bacterium]
MRINKYIASSGMCSRRKAEEFIQEGRVTINGKVAVLSDTVEENDTVLLDGKVVEPEKKQIMILLNKPTGITCTTERHIEGNIIDYVNYPERIFPIGRLDKDSQGLILLTNQGDLVNQLLRVENGHEKEYEVNVDRKITEDFLAKMRKGVRIYNPVTNSYVTTNPCKIKQTGERSFKIILTQGYNRQIRRMCSAFDYHVISLKRVRFMNLTLAGVKYGKWRELTAEEIESLVNYHK